MNATAVASTSVPALYRALAAGESVVVWDVRTPQEFAAGHVPGAANYPLGSLELAAAIVAQRENRATVNMICASGGRSRQAGAQALAGGVARAFTVDGGTQAWIAAGFPVQRIAQARAVISLERQVRIAAGALVLIGVMAGTLLHAGFYALSGFVGAGLVFAGITDWCGMGLLLARMPWNQR